MNTFIAIALAISGAVAVLAGTAMLTVAAIQALRPMSTTTEAVIDADGKGA